MGINTCTIAGNLGRDPELKHTPAGKAICTCSIAYKKTKDAETQWFRVIAWEKLGELIAQYATKGQMLVVTGRMENREYQNNAGEKKTVFEIIANDVQLPRGESGGERPPQQRQQAPKQQMQAWDADDDSVPF